MWLHHHVEPPFQQGETLGNTNGQDYDIVPMFDIVGGYMAIAMAPDWLNYHHLKYFWVVAREGSIVRAAEELGVSQPTISQQLQELERSCKCELFERRGRTLALTDAGRMVFSYADQIFSMGRELMGRIRAHGQEAHQRLVVGVGDSVSKLATLRLLEPAFRGRARIVLRDDKVERLLPELAAGRLDMVLSDTPAGAGSQLRVFNHYLGECELKFFAQHETARRMEGAFPHCLEGFPMVVPTDNTLRRRQIDAWLKARGVRPKVVAEVEDAAMITSLGFAGVGVFAAPSVIEDILRKTFGAEVIGTADGVLEKFQAITTGHEVTHPLVQHVCDEARRTVFADGWRAEEVRNKAARKGERQAAK